MADRRVAKSSEVLADHAYTGGYSLDDVYGKKKPSATSSGASGGGGGPYGDSSAAAGPYGGPQYASPYTKPAGKPVTTEDDYSEASRPSPISSDYGRHEESRPSYQKPSAYGGHETESYRPPRVSSGYGKHDDYGESRPSYQKPSAYEEEYESQGRPSVGGPPGRKPGGYGGDGYEAEQYPPVGGLPGRKPAGYGQDDEFASRPPPYEEEYESQGRPSVGGPAGRKPAAYGWDGYEAEQGGRPGRKPAVYGQDDEFSSRPPSSQPHGQYGGGIQDNEYSEVRIPGPRPVWQEDTGESGYGGPGRKPYGRPEGEFATEYGSSRPTPGRHEEPLDHHRYGNPAEEKFKYGNPAQENQKYGYPSEEKYKYGNPHEEQERRKHNFFPQDEGHGGVAARPISYGRPGYGGHDVDDRLASQTASLSLGEEGYRPKRDDSDDSDDEKRKYKKHEEKHRQRKHHDDY